MTQGHPPSPRSLRFTRPADTWLQALPVGNGRLGAMIFGATDTDRLSLNTDTFWSGGPRHHGIVDGPSTLAAVRGALRDGDHAAADRASMRLQGPYTESFQPLADLWIEDLRPTAGGVSGYERSLDLGTGLARTRWHAGDRLTRRTIAASAPDDVLIVHEESPSGGVHLRVRLTSPHPQTTVAAEPHGLVLTTRAPERVWPDYADVPDPIRYGAHGVVGVVGLRALDADGEDVTLDSGDDWLEVRAPGRVTLVIAASDGYLGPRTRPEPGPAPAVRRVEATLTAASGLSWTQLRDRAERDHAELMGRVHLDLAAPADDRPTDERLDAVRAGGTDRGLVELLFDYGRYLLIASSRPGTLPATLQGIWNESVRPPWSSNWTTNINLQMNYWPAESTALPECHEPLITLIEQSASEGARTAAEIYGARGWVLHHNADVWGTAWPVGNGRHDPKHVMWSMGGPWLCAHLVENVRFAGTRAAAERAWPLLCGASEFLLDLLVEDRDGFLVTAPSTSPENSFAGADGTPAAVDAMPTMDAWLVRELFANLGDLADILGRSGDPLVQRVRTATARLADLPLAADGRLLEWRRAHPEIEVGHRHFSHLYGLYPGKQVDVRSTPALAHACRLALQRRLDAGGGATGWSRAWAVALWARLEEGDRASADIDLLLRTSMADNLFDLHPPELFQIDGNLGVSAAIAEMLLASHCDDVRLLPALPTAWAAGAVRGLRSPHGLAVDLSWRGGRLERVDLHARRAIDLRVSGPGLAPVRVVLPDGGTRTLEPRR